MRFFEYEAREIVKRAGIPVTDFGFARSADEAREIAERIGGPTVIKSQVLTGGRMKAGGVKFADTPDEAAAHAEEILKLEIGGHMPRGVLVDPRAEVKQEYYAGVVWDGTPQAPGDDLLATWAASTSSRWPRSTPTTSGARHFSTLLPVQRLPGQAGDRLHRRDRPRADTASRRSSPGSRGCSSSAT